MNQKLNLKQRFVLWKKDVLENQQKIVLSIILGIIAIILNLISGAYTEKKGSSSPPDLILDHLVSLDLSYIYVGLFFIVFAVFIIYPLIFLPSRIHHMIGILSLFGLIKAGFSALTHLKIPEGAIDISWTPFFYDWLAFSNYLFFAGNVGLAFLGYLVYRKNKFIKYFMLSSSIVLALTALLMHRHYSIDVLSSFFIVFGVYKIGNYLFE